MSDAVLYGDLMFSFGVLIALKSPPAVKRMARTLVPVAGRMPLTAVNLEWLAGTGASMLITTTPRFDGRSFGTNLTEAVITAAVGSERRLSIDETNTAIDDLGIRPGVTRF